MNLADIILGLVILLVLAAMIVPAIIDIIIEIKCFDLVVQYRHLGGSCWGMKDCGNDNCRLKRFCYIHRHAITPEVIAELESLLEERRKELKTEDKNQK